MPTGLWSASSTTKRPRMSDTDPHSLRDRVAAVIAAANGRYDNDDPDTIADALLNEPKEN
jgi:hypothetical protein